MSKGHCRLSCPIEFYWQGQSNLQESTGSCLRCDVSCQTCNGGTKSDCDSCSNGFILDNKNMCNSVCKKEEGEFNVPEEMIDLGVLGGVCQGCFRFCQECNGPHNGDCTKCKENYILESRTYCIRDCTESLDMFITATQDDCDTCGEGSYCQTCSGKSFSQCLSCQDDLYLVPESYSYCKSYKESEYGDICTCFDKWKQPVYTYEQCSSLTILEVTKFCQNLSIFKTGHCELCQPEYIYDSNKRECLRGICPIGCRQCYIKEITAEIVCLITEEGWSMSNKPIPSFSSHSAHLGSEKDRSIGKWSRGGWGGICPCE